MFNCRWDTASGLCKEKGFFDFYYSCKVTYTKECPRAVYRNNSYNEHFAKYVMFRLASASQARAPQQCLSNISPFTKVIVLYLAL